MKRVGKFLETLVSATAVFLLVNPARAQDLYPPTLKVPVTFYDFHSDGSNQDFNLGNNPAVILPGMVQSTLDSAGLPVGTTAYLYSWGIGKWFRPWKQSLLGQCSDFARPAYADGGRTVAAVNTVGYDTSYKNVKIPDTLVFTYDSSSPGVYEYADTGFFPLDNKGFGNEGLAHNYSFAAVIHREIQYRQGLAYYFQSSDDMWVFINGHLVLDLGGIHGATAGQFNLDNFAAALGLSPGDSAALDIFWTQRSGQMSGVKLSTNIVTACPVKLLTLFFPNDTVVMGDSVVRDVSGLSNINGHCPNPDSAIHWNLSPIGTPSTLSTTTGPTITFYARQAYTTYIIGLSAVLKCPNPCGFSDTLASADTIYVRPPVSSIYMKEPGVRNAKNKNAIAYFNLRGQRLFPDETNHINGVVLERIIAPDGKANIRKIILEMDSR